MKSLKLSVYPFSVTCYRSMYNRIFAVFSSNPGQYIGQYSSNTQHQHPPVIGEILRHPNAGERGSTPRLGDLLFSRTKTRHQLLFIHTVSPSHISTFNALLYALLRDFTNKNTLRSWSLFSRTTNNPQGEIRRFDPCWRSVIICPKKLILSTLLKLMHANAIIIALQSWIIQ